MKSGQPPPSLLFFASLFFFYLSPACESAYPASLIFLIRTWGASFCRTAIIVSTHIGSLGTLRSAPRGDCWTPKNNSLDRSCAPLATTARPAPGISLRWVYRLCLCAFCKHRGMSNENCGMRWPESGELMSETLANLSEFCPRKFHTKNSEIFWWVIFPKKCSAWECREKTWRENWANNCCMCIYPAWGFPSS